MTESMLTKEEILKTLRDSGQNMTAPEIAKRLGVSKTETNSMLYLMEDKILSKTNTTPPYWSILPLQEQITHALADYSEKGCTAVELSNELCVQKNEVNSIPYQFEGILYRKNEDNRPRWFMC